MLSGEVVGFAAVDGEIVEFPGLVMRGDELPMADSNCSMVVMAPPEICMQRFRVRFKCGQQTASGGCRNRDSLPFRGMLSSGSFQDRRYNVDQVNRYMPKLSCRLNFCRPVNNERG